MNPFYGIWNYSHIQQQAQLQYHQNQVQQVAEATHKLQEFLDSVDKIDPAYNGVLTATCCAVLLAHARKHGII